MAGKSNTSATFFAQKKLLGKAHTSNLKVDGEEVIGSNIQTATSLLFGEAIPESPSTTDYVTSSVAGSDATVEYIPFVLTALTGTTYDANDSGGGAGDDSIFGGYGHDTITGGSGNDRIRGGFGRDLFVWSSGFDLIEDFRLSENDRIGLQSGIGYELHQQGDDLQLISSLGVTTLLNVDLGGFSAIDHIVAL